MVEAGVGVGLENPAVIGEMPARVLAVAVAGVEVHRRRRVRSAEWPVVANVGPQPADDRLALGQNRHRRVVAVNARRVQNVAPDQLDERRKRRDAGADPVRQG